jgi:Protein of unknown function (DUF4238)
VDEAKLHHTVPQFYLRGFANDDERITTVRLPGDKVYTSRVKNTAAINRFYSIDGHPDGADVFEKGLSELEGLAAQVLREIVDGAWPLSEQQRLRLGFFMAVQHLRGPDHRRTLEYIAAQMARLEVQVNGRDNVKQWVQTKFGLVVDDDDAEVLWHQVTQPGGPPVTVAPLAHIKEIINGAQRLLPYLVSRPWKLVRFSRRSLITCDSPVGLVPAENAEPWQGVGFETAWGINFPLTRKLGLMMTSVEPVIEFDYPAEKVRAGRLDVVEPGTTAIAKFFNSFTVGSASEYLFHHPDDASVLSSPLPEPTLSNISGPDLDLPVSGTPHSDG